MNHCTYAYRQAMLKTGNATADAMMPVVIRFILYRIAGTAMNMRPSTVTGMVIMADTTAMNGMAMMTTITEMIGMTGATADMRVAAVTATVKVAEGEINLSRSAIQT